MAVYSQLRTPLRNQVFVAIFIVDPTTDGLAWFCANIADHQVNRGVHASRHL